jgi:hypothetical protein
VKELREWPRSCSPNGTVKVVFGYEEGRGGVRPIMATTPLRPTGPLDARCVHNWRHLTPRRARRPLGKPAVVVKACGAKAVAGLIAESQVKRQDVVVVGVRCGGVVGADLKAVHPETSPRCAVCAPASHALDNCWAPLAARAQAGRRGPGAKIRRECREGALRRSAGRAVALVRCHACARSPDVLLLTCVADKSRPQWIEPSATPTRQPSPADDPGDAHGPGAAWLRRVQRACPSAIRSA